MDERLLVQRTLFAGPFPEAPAELYSRAERGAAVRERDRVVLDGFAVLSTNTYFGRFPASYWQRWTSADRVEVTLVASGSGLIRLLASDSKGISRTVSTARVTDAEAEHVRLSAAIDRFVDGGALWLEFETADAPLTVSQARWTVPAVRRRRATVVVICTYNRADDCIATLQTLASDVEVASGLSAVYVIDQGTDTVDSRAAFPQVQEALGSLLRYVQQPNLGGAGGFTRGIFEAIRNETVDRVNLLLMDDDIRLEPDTAVRLTGLADAATKPILVGGQMLNLFHPERLHVGAESADLDILRAGLPVPDALTNADVTEQRQEVRVDAAYNAWWTCLIPSEVVSAVGYPLPVFFQWDDIEFGLRAREAGFPTVTLPGAGVWHADFAWKNWDDWSRYFSFRNSLITSALHGDFDRSRIVEHLARQLANYLVSMRYGLAVLMLKAVEDFLRGPEVLADGGAAVSREIRALWSSHPETKNHPASAVPGVDADTVERAVPAGTPSMPKSVLAKRVLWQLLGKARGKAAVADADAYWWHVSLFETAVVTDPSQEGVRVRRYDRQLMRELGRRGATVLWRLTREGERARDQWRAGVPELTSRAAWSRLFDSQ
ncbi:glycosyltransferase [Geodermatophilus sabuli]|uniref:glycosyltransferase n=1 Tax=Geodermatophilus sabuli TaxID=1564158 RepID=UPI00185ACE35|nr:glycosyltransferase [Geodermatophilus sabuli]MBB3086102.1 galactofuranosylgalactofuranosylrhamnosyl-N-acetylglucosaminyl-diphospho-decaprenol beta-1,5/1,6-galactofuranosyltransferase [Geodermatophilus sabuli]